MQVGHLARKQIVLKGQAAIVKVVDTNLHCLQGRMHLLDLGQRASWQKDTIPLRQVVGQVGGVQQDGLHDLHLALLHAHHKGFSFHGGEEDWGKVVVGSRNQNYRARIEEKNKVKQKATETEKALNSINCAPP